jgi:predicted nuclease of predicted toxin-antitoxin system
MLRLLANENIHAAAVVELRKRGHDVVWIGEGARGASDESVLAQALAERRILLSFDKDFGELVYRRGSEASCGVVRFRIPMHSADAVAARISDVLASRSDWAGMLPVVGEDRIRMSVLPKTNRTT